LNRLAQQQNEIARREHNGKSRAMAYRLGLRGILVGLAGVSGAAAVVSEVCFGPSTNPIRSFIRGNSSEGVLNDPAPSHYVTPTQLRASNAIVRRTIDDIVATTADGRRMDWSTLSGGYPVLLVFIKSGCPCSVEFERYFHRLYEAYRGAARFAGVIDGDQSAAARYATANAVPYPVIADPEEKLIDRFEAKNGGYAALLDSQGSVAGFWPGFSDDAMSDLGRRISRLAGIAELPIETAGLPKKLTTGCHFGVSSDRRRSPVTLN
jgi:peroxiredoxin